MSGVPNILRPLREPGVIEGPAAAAAVMWPPPGPAPAQEPGAAELLTGPAPAQQAQGVMYNAGHNGSHFMDEGAQKGGGGGEETACPPALFGLRSREAEGALQPVPRAIVAQSSTKLFQYRGGGSGGRGGCNRDQMFLPGGLSAQSTEAAQQGQRNVWQRVQL